MHGMTTSSRWWELAACQSADPELFFPVTEIGPAQRQLAQAKAVCARCDVRQLCLDYALETRQAHGLWGGLSADERRDLAELVRAQELSRTG